MAIIDDEVGECNVLWSPTFSVPSVTVASGASGQAVFSFTAPSDAAAGDHSGDETMLHATSEDVTLSPSVSAKAVANQIYGLTAGYYSNETGVVKDSIEVIEGMSVPMKFTVTNDGNGNDEVTLSLVGAPAWITLGQSTALVGPGQTMTTLTVDIAAPASDARGVHLFQVTATSADGTTSSTTGNLAVTVKEKVDSTGGPTTEELDEEEGGLPGFGALSAIAAIGAVLLIRRRL
jgi:PGF-CTERM protein